MKWIDVSNNCGGHNGEYDWKCSICGAVDWQAHGVNPNKDGTQCRKCGARPEAEKEVVKVPKDNGGPAFPSAGYRDNGMTLRDYFAAKAMQAEIARSTRGVEDSERDIVESAYDYADAMLEARES